VGKSDTTSKFEALATFAVADTNFEHLRSSAVSSMHMI